MLPNREPPTVLDISIKDWVTNSCLRLGEFLSAFSDAPPILAGVTVVSMAGLLLSNTVPMGIAISRHYSPLEDPVPNIIREFFDINCLGQFTSITSNRYSDVETFMSFYSSGLSVPMQFSALFTFTVSVMVAQLGPIPIPYQGSRLSVSLWLCWMATLLLQILFVFISIIASCDAYNTFQDTYKSCLRLSPGTSYSTLNIISTLTFSLQPFFLFKLLLITMYWATFVEGLKVYLRVRNLGATYAGYDVLLLKIFAFVVFALPVGYSILAWAVTLSAIFTLAFMTTLVLFMFLTVAAFFTFMILVNYAAVRAAEKSQGDAAKIAEQVHDMLWWIPLLINESKDIPFVNAMRYCIIVFALAPIMVFGTWLAFSSYGGSSFLLTLGLIYDLNFYEFKALTSIPPIDFGSIALLPNWANLGGAYLAGAAQSPTDLLQSSRSLYGLSLVLAIIKIAVSFLNDLFSAMDLFEGRNRARFSKEASKSLEQEPNLSPYTENNMQVSRAKAALEMAKAALRISKEAVGRFVSCCKKRGETAVEGDTAPQVKTVM